jgi:hypothetical protein
MTPSYGITTRCCAGLTTRQAALAARAGSALGVDVPAAATGAVERLRAEFEAHLHDDGVWFDSRAWLITARRRAG